MYGKIIQLLIIKYLIIVTIPQPNIHPGSISSTGRQRVSTATSTAGAQLIGGGISPTLFTSNQVDIK